MDLCKAIAYFITFRTYGTWLHGDAEGSVDRDHNTYGTPLCPPDAARQEEARGRLRSSPVELSIDQRRIVDAAIRSVADYRGWRVRALNVRSTHVHVVVSGGHAPERMMGDFKRWATRRLRESGVIAQNAIVWSAHGSTRHLFDEANVFEACDFTLNRQ